MWTAAVMLLVLGVAWAGLAVYGSFRWAAATRALRAGLVPSTETIRTHAVDFRELEALPAPVRRYLGRALVEGAPLIAAVRLRQEGEFNMSETGDRWRPFSADQWVTVRPAGFDWDARIRIAPGVAVRVHDAYLNGEGILHAAVLGLFAVVRLRGTGDIARGELMRFLAEAAWYPTALLPSQGVRWTEVDARAACAELEAGEHRVKLTFRFNAQDLIESVEAESRGRVVGGQVQHAAWGGRFRNYQGCAGMLVPLEGEVYWRLPEGVKPYWRGRITDLDYQFAR